MNKYKNIATLFIKGFSIFLFYRFLLQLPAMISVIVTVTSFDNSFYLQNRSILLVAILSILLTLVLSIVLWVYANKVAKYMVLGLEPEEDTEATIEYQALETIGFSLIGLVIIIITLPTIMTTIIQMWRNYDFLGQFMEDAIYLQLIVSLVQFILGLLLLLKSRGIVNAINKLRKA